jgi:DMSO/TMAO reductase YedYZ molybdopterin-dependent catalytic subunit
MVAARNMNHPTNNLPDGHAAESRPRLPPGQQLVARDKWPFVGERDCLTPEGSWTLEITGQVSHPFRMALDKLSGFPQKRIVTDIHCVTRWSKYDAVFGGVLLADLLDRARATRDARFVSFVARTSRRHSSSLPLETALSLGALLATSFGDEPLPDAHGGPLRSIVPGKYFYKSVKWVEKIELLAEDRLGYWESDAGYHNNADPWLQQRYIASCIDRREAARLIESRNFSGLDLQGLDASHRDLRGLVARDALLRNASFQSADVSRADFARANLSNASFRFANLAGSNLSSADLEGADFAAADLRDTDLRGSSLFGASFGDVTQPAAAMKNGARIDRTTRIERESLETLVPEQRAYFLECLESCDS